MAKALVAPPSEAPAAAVVEDAVERALQAAGRLFREKGFAATTVREIAKAAGMLPGSLHYRYASKDELLVALMHRGVQRGIAAMSAAVGPERDPIQRLRLALRTHLALLLSEDDALYVLLFDWRSLPPGARKGVERERQRYYDFWDQLLAEGHATGRARPVLDIALVRQFGFGAANWAATWYRKDEGRTPEQIADAFFEVFCFGLLREGERPADVDALFTASMSPPPHTTS